MHYGYYIWISAGKTFGYFPPALTCISHYSKLSLFSSNNVEVGMCEENLVDATLTAIRLLIDLYHQDKIDRTALLEELRVKVKFLNDFINH